ncbi:MAG: DUF4339 domain-containing protein [Halobacteriovoraceae bacterium]|jgi:hypothetical protein|nr:DUF4339 domain-containing protein [Halobacteriovoraceae bacterium]
MDGKWYYVEDGERKGPVEKIVIDKFIEAGSIGDDDYIWTKGYENWVKVKDVEEFNQEKVTVEDDFPEVIQGEMSLKVLSNNENSIFLKIGTDRGGQDVEYGPYSLEIIQKLYRENRINEKTFLFLRGMTDWTMLADFSDYAEVFEETPPPITEEDRRKNIRKPFIARMYLENKQEVYVGICRDISIGGMQVLIDHVPANVGDGISINVHPDNTEHHFVAGGEVVRLLDGGQGFSFRFVDLNEDAKEAIQNYLTHG